jgi:hypothetical protein
VQICSNAAFPDLEWPFAAYKGNMGQWRVSEKSTDDDHARLREKNIEYVAPCMALLQAGFVQMLLRDVFGMWRAAMQEGSGNNQW